MLVIFSPDQKNQSVKAGLKSEGWERFGWTYWHASAFFSLQLQSSAHKKSKINNWASNTDQRPW